MDKMSQCEMGGGNDKPEKKTYERPEFKEFNPLESVGYYYYYYYTYYYYYW